MSDSINVTIPDVGEIEVSIVSGPTIEVSASNIPGPQGEPGVGVPEGGTTGQVLKKKTNADHDTEWGDVSGGVTDVQVNGTSVVTDGVANVPIVTSFGQTGVVKITRNMGLDTHSDGSIEVIVASNSQTKAGAVAIAVNAPIYQHLATYYGLAKAAGADMKNVTGETVGVYPEAQKSAISTMLSAPVTVTGTTPTITALSGIQYVCGEVATLDITLPASGIVDVVFQSGSTPTVLTTTTPTGMTVEWANGFDSTALDADTLYEINIKMVGSKCLGVAGSWS